LEDREPKLHIEHRMSLLACALVTRRQAGKLEIKNDALGGFRNFDETTKTVDCKGESACPDKRSDRGKLRRALALT
jgi:hypothetical protein